MMRIENKSMRGFLIDPVLLTNIIRTVWLRVRRHADENLGFKGLTFKGLTCNTCIYKHRRTQG